MNGRQFYLNVRNTLREALNRVEILHNEIAEGEEKKLNKDGQYSQEYMNRYRSEWEPQRLQKKMEINRIIYDARIAAHKIIDDYAAELSSYSDLKGEEMNSDAALLNCGIKLKSADLETLLRRNSTNPTMVQLILRYADEHGVKVNAVFTGSNQRAATVREIHEVVDTVLKWHSDPKAKMFDRLCEPGSIFHQVFADDYSDWKPAPGVEVVSFY